MRNEKVVYSCDECGCEVKCGFLFIGRIVSVKNGESDQKVELLSNEESHYCKSCFKAKLGMKERAPKDAAV